MVYKLAMSAEKRWQKMQGYKRIGDMLSGARFVDGELQKDPAKKEITI